MSRYKKNNDILLFFSLSKSGLPFCSRLCQLYSHVSSKLKHVTNRPLPTSRVESRRKGVTLFSALVPPFAEAPSTPPVSPRITVDQSANFKHLTHSVMTIPIPLQEALRDSITSGTFIDTKFWVFSERCSKPGRVGKPKALFANGHVVRSVPRLSARTFVNSNEAS